MKMWYKIILLMVFGCSKSLTTSFDLRGIVSGNRMAAVPLGISLGRGELDVEGICLEPGMVCQNCTLAIQCIPLPVGFLKVPLETCAEGYTCNAHLGKCTTNPVPECDPISQSYTHTCEQVGIFPDAHDCRKFHLCSPPDGLPDGRPADHRAALCPRHYGYNPQTAQCSIPLRQGQCDIKPIPECTSVGQSGALITSSNHYYVCLLRHGVLYPQIFICPHGWYFWDSYCRPEPQNKSSNTRPDDNKHDKNSNEESSSEKESTVPTEVPSTEKATTSRMDSFFSTNRAITYPPDTFLADKFDLSNYESTDDVAPTNNDDFANSFESGNDFW